MRETSARHKCGCREGGPERMSTEREAEGVSTLDSPASKRNLPLFPFNLKAWQARKQSEILGHRSQGKAE